MRQKSTTPELKIVDFCRNYGQTAAMMAGIDHALGTIIVSLDADMQNDPGDIPALLQRIDEGYDVASGWRVDRRDAAIRRNLVSRIANRIISRISGVRLNDYGCTLKAYRAQVVRGTRLYGEMHRFIPIYAAWEGARVTEIPVTHHARRFGRSKYGLGRIARVLLDLFTLYFIDRAFDRPMQFFGKLGLGCLALAGLTLGWALTLKIRLGVSLIQTPLPLLAATVGLSGVLFILLGIIAEVQARIYFESRGRPPYRIKEVVQRAAVARLRVANRRW